MTPEEIHQWKLWRGGVNMFMFLTMMSIMVGSSDAMLVPPVLPALCIPLAFCLWIGRPKRNKYKAPSKPDTADEVPNVD